MRDAALAELAQAITVPGGQLQFDEGEPCRGFPMVLSGEVRVARGAPNGRSLELYRGGPGELCVASTACLFGHSTLIAHGITIKPTELVVLSPLAFDRCTAVEAFRRFLFGIVADRLGKLKALAETVAFQRFDQRLASTLLGHGSVVQGTHQALADELGTVREIVTGCSSASRVPVGRSSAASRWRFSTPPRCAPWLRARRPVRRRR